MSDALELLNQDPPATVIEGIELLTAVAKCLNDDLLNERMDNDQLRADLAEIATLCSEGCSPDDFAWMPGLDQIHEIATRHKEKE